MKLPPNARRIALTVIALVAVLIGGIWLGGHPNRLPGFVRNSLTASGPNRAIDEAVERIENYYYRPIGSGQLQEASIGGMVAGLHDRFSHYLSPSEFGTFIAPPHFTGIGVAVAASHQGLLIAHVFDSSPAQRAGLRPGETIVGVDGRSLAGLSTEHATSLIKGEPGTSVVLTLRHGGAGGPTRPGHSRKGRHQGAGGRLRGPDRQRPQDRDHRVRVVHAGLGRRSARST